MIYTNNLCFDLKEKIEPVYQIISSHESYMKETISELYKIVHSDMFIEQFPKISGTEWDNIWQSPWDIITQYAMIRKIQPKQIIEIGSGVSTFISTHALKLNDNNARITSIDPEPRIPLTSLNHKIIKESLKISHILNEMESSEDTLIFVDGSHIVKQDSDCHLLLIDGINHIKESNLFFHDIFLPWHYPKVWESRNYNEQYVLADHLLNSTFKGKQIYSNAYTSRLKKFSDKFGKFWQNDSIRNLHAEGSGIWLLNN